MFINSKVHITSETLKKLNGEFQVEPGNGHLRDDYLLKSHNEQNLETYFIQDSEVSRSCTRFFVLHPRPLCIS